jgi:hypothetical protein
MSEKDRSSRACLFDYALCLLLLAVMLAQLLPLGRVP